MAALAGQYYTAHGDWEPIEVSLDQTGQNPSGQNVPTYWHHGRCDDGNVAEKMLQHTLSLARSACIGWAFACRLAGPKYFECAGIGRFGNLLRHLIDEMDAWRNECQVCQFVDGQSCP